MLASWPDGGNTHAGLKERNWERHGNKQVTRESGVLLFFLKRK